MILFATSTNEAFFPGTVALARSIRRFYDEDEARLLVLSWDRNRGFERQMRALDHVVLRQYLGNPREQGCSLALALATQFIEAGGDLPGQTIVAAVDSDVWLLSRLDQLTSTIMPGDACVWYDRRGGSLQSQKYVDLFGIDLPEGFDHTSIRFNSGIAFFGMSEGVLRLAHDYAAWCADPELFKACFNDQSVMRAAVLKRSLLGQINLRLSEDAKHYNPIWGDADEMAFSPETGRWINLDTGGKQFLFHATGGAKRRVGRDKPWQRPDEWPECVLRSFEWVQQ